MGTKNDNLEKIKKYCDLYKKNKINFDEYVKVVTRSIIQLDDISKFVKKSVDYGN